MFERFNNFSCFSRTFSQSHFLKPVSRSGNLQSGNPGFPIKTTDSSLRLKSHSDRNPWTIVWLPLVVVVSSCAAPGLSCAVFPSVSPVCPELSSLSPPQFGRLWCGASECCGRTNWARPDPAEDRDSRGSEFLWRSDPIITTILIVTFSLVPSICSSCSPSMSLALNSGMYWSMWSPRSHWQTSWVDQEETEEKGSSQGWGGGDVWTVTH